MAIKQRYTTRQLRELLVLKKIRNDDELVGDTGGKIPYVAFRNGFKKKTVTSAWQVLVPGRRTDPDGSYQDGFNKTFLVSDPGVVVAPERAKQWASERYDIHDWVKTPFGAWTSKAHLDARLVELLPEQFDPKYRDPAVQKLTTKLFLNDDSVEQRLFRVQVQLYAKPEPPLYVLAADADDARRQVTQLFMRVAGTRVLDGLKLLINET